MKRRKIGPAYERSPAEDASDWLHRNLLVVLSAIFFSFIFLVTFNVAVNYGFNFLVTGGDETAEARFDANHPTAVTIKIIGTLLILAILVKTRSK